MYDAFLRSGMFRDFAEAAPGFEELMCLGKLYDLATDSGFGRVVFDAPATGHLKTLIDVPAATLKAVLVGPLNHNARKIQDLLMDPERTRVVVATLAEELAVREALELEAFCRERRMGVGPVIVNQRVSQRFSDDEIRAMHAIAEPGPALATAVGVATDEHELAVSQDESVAPLAESRVAVWDLPRVIDHEPAALLEGLVSHLSGVMRDG
jgi:anion-transporting  ArsA/GET3 family ATPase